MTLGTTALVESVTRPLMEALWAAAGRQASERRRRVSEQAAFLKRWRRLNMRISLASCKISARCKFRRGADVAVRGPGELWDVGRSGARAEDAQGID